MDESDFPNREAYVRARLTYLKNKLKDMGAFGGFDCPDLDPEMELAFLEQVAAIEAEPTTTYAHQLIGRGICLPPPDDMEEDLLSEKLWEIIHGLAGLRVFLENTGHLNDRELYEQLWKEDLNEFTWDMSHCTNGAMHLDIIGSGSEDDTRIWLSYYADDQQRKEWQDQFPDETLPPKKEPLTDRDDHLPRPDYGC
jgi:hypothetical protein